MHVLWKLHHTKQVFPAFSYEFQIYETLGGEKQRVVILQTGSTQSNRVPFFGCLLPASTYQRVAPVPQYVR